MKQVAVNSAIVLGILVLAFLVWEFREALFLFIFSLAVAAAARPYIETLVNRHIPKALAFALVYLLFIGSLILIFWVIGKPLINEIQDISNNLAITYAQIWKTWPSGTQIQQFIAQQLPSPTDLFKSLTTERASSVISSLLGFTITSAAFFGQVLTVLVLSIYWNIDRVHFERLWLSLLPVDSRARARDIWNHIEQDFGAYIRSETMQSILAGLLLGLGLWALGIHYPVLLALFGALAWLIPWFGGIIALLPIAFTGFSQTLGLGIFASVYALGVLLFLQFFIEPRFIRRSGHQFSSLLSIMLIIALIQPFGLLGFLAAPPLAAAIELIFRYFYILRNQPMQENFQSAEEIVILRGRIIQVRDILARAEDQAEPQTNNLLDRLESLVDQSERTLRWERTDDRQFLRRPTRLKRP